MIPKPLQPQRISVFMPQRMTDEEIELLFIVRQEILEVLLRSLNEEKPDSIPQHHLLIGQRGMGKTTLLKRLDVELHKLQYRQRFIPFTFPEEQYNIDRLSKFWLNSLDALADTLQTEGDTGNAFKLDAKITSLSFIRDEEQLSRNAYELLVNTTEDLGRRPVFLLDNLNLIFERLGEAEQSRLRKLISEPGAPIFIGASATPIDDDLGYDAPFYDAFDVHYLAKLDFNQTLQMLRHLAYITNQEELREQLLDNNLARLETLHALTGGNVRTVVILFSLVAQGFSANVFLDLEALIDQMTPLYKARFEELPKQQQVVVDSIALHWDPANLENLRDKTLLENSQLSAQLDRLTKSGWINKLGKRKTANYEISERFFNIWYLMRRSSRRQRRDLIWLTRFLQGWFSKTELRKRAEEYTQNMDDKCHPYEISFALALARASQDEKTSKKLLETSYRRLIELYDGNNDRIEQILGVDPLELNKEWLTEYQRTKVYNIFKEAFDLIQEGHFLNAEQVVKKVFEIDEKNVLVWRVLAELYRQNLKRYLDAEQAYKNVIEIDENEFNAWRGLADLYNYNLERYPEAEQAYKKAIQIRENDSDAWRGLGELYRIDLHRYPEAEQAYKKAIQIDENDTYAWGALGELYQINLHRYPEAEQAYKKVIEIDENDPRPWRGLAELYRIHLNRYPEAEQAYKKIIEINENESNAWRGLAELYRIDLHRYPDAEQAYKKAIEIDENEFNAWRGLADLYSYNLERYSEAEQAYKKAIQIDENDSFAWRGLGELYRIDFKRYSEAEQAYKKAIQIDENDPYTWGALGELYRLNLHRYPEAEQAYKRSFEIDENDLYFWGGLAELYRIDLNLYPEAEQAYKKAIQIDENYADAWGGLAELYRINLSRYPESEQAYKKAIQIRENDVRPFIGLGELYRLNLSRYLESEQAYKKAIQIDQRIIIVWRSLGDLYRIDFNRYLDAEQAYKKAIEINENDSYSWGALGDLYRINLHRYPESEQAYKKAIEFDENDPRPLRGLGELYRLNLNRYSEAEQAYKKAIQIDEKSALAWGALGDLYRINLHRYPEAEQAYNKAIEFDENDAEILGSLGNLLIDHLGDYEKAKEVLKKAIQIDNNSIINKANLVFLLRDQLSEIESGSELFEQSEQDYPDYLQDTAMLHRASFAEYEQNWGIASKFWRNALDLVKEDLPEATQDDWYRSAAVSIRLGYGEKLLNLFDNTGHNRIFRPFYEAVKALTTDSEEYLKNEVAAEIRDIALQIFQFMKSYNKSVKK